MGERRLWKYVGRPLRGVGTGSIQEDDFFVDPHDDVEVDLVTTDLASGGSVGTEEMVSREVMNTSPVGVWTTYCRLDETG